MIEVQFPLRFWWSELWCGSLFYFFYFWGNLRYHDWRVGECEVTWGVDDEAGG